MKQTDYKWIDIDREKNTTENPIYWIEGVFILFFIIIIPIIFS